MSDQLQDLVYQRDRAEQEATWAKAEIQRLTADLTFTQTRLEDSASDLLAAQEMVLTLRREAIQLERKLGEAQDARNLALANLKQAQMRAEMYRPGDQAHRDALTAMIPLLDQHSPSSLSFMSLVDGMRWIAQQRDAARQECAQLTTTVADELVHGKEVASALEESRREVQKLGQDKADQDAEVARLQKRIEHVSMYSMGKCRKCGSKVGAHRMYCQYYVGPLEHKWTHSYPTTWGWNEVCSCGKVVEVGGGSTKDIVCPDDVVYWRGPAVLKPDA